MENLIFAQPKKEDIILQYSFFFRSLVVVFFSLTLYIYNFCSLIKFRYIPETTRGIVLINVQLKGVQRPSLQITVEKPICEFILVRSHTPALQHFVQKVSRQVATFRSIFVFTQVYTLLF